MDREVNIKVQLVTINDIHNFAFTSGRYRCSVLASHGGFTVNAKSILGLLSLNLSEPIDVIFKGLKDDEDISEFNEWIVK